MGMFGCGALTGALSLAFALEVVASAVIDVRTRRFPNALATMLALTCACLTLCRCGWGSLALHAIAALTAGTVLIAVEGAWRRAHGGSAGLGGGDIKFLFGFMLLDPMFAVASFSSGLVLLAGFGVLLGRRTLPLLPFVAAGASLILIAGSPVFI